MKIYLIRHGRSNANEVGKLISDSNDGLSELGVAQSKKLSKYLADISLNPAFIYSSPWRRAIETASICYSNRKILFDSRIVETNPGIFKDMLESEFAVKFPEFNKSIYNKYRGGESHMQMSARVKDWLNDCIFPSQSTQVEVVVFSHGGPISVILQELLGINTIERYPSFRVPNGSIATLEFDTYHGRFILHDIVTPGRFL